MTFFSVEVISNSSTQQSARSLPNTSYICPAYQDTLKNIKPPFTGTYMYNYT